MLAKIAYSNPGTELDHPILLDNKLFLQRDGTRSFMLKGTTFEYFAGSAKWYRPIQFDILKSYSFEEIFEEIISSKGISDDRKDLILFHLGELSNLPIHLGFVPDPDVDDWFADEDD